MNTAIISALQDTLAAASALTAGLEAITGLVAEEATKAVPQASAPAAQAQALLHTEFEFEKAAPLVFDTDPNRDAKGRLVKGHTLNQGRKRKVEVVQPTLDIQVPEPQAVIVQAPAPTQRATEVEVIRTHKGGVTLKTVAALKEIGCPDEVVTASTRKDAYPRVESWCISNAIDMVIGAAV